MNNQKSKLKSSISLPYKVTPLWRQYAKRLLDSPCVWLKLFAKHQPRRQKLRTYTRNQGEFMKINVYWPVEVYDQVHAVAAALRVSVSHLIWLILNLLSNGVQLPTQKFSNYVFSLIEWSENSMTFGETLQFRHQPPDI